MLSGADLLAVLRALLSYERRVRPTVRAELEHWEGVAARIPDPALRQAASSALDQKAGNAEATAIISILAPRVRRRQTLRAMTALQVAIDYLDTLGERPGEDPLADGLSLHQAIVDAVSPGPATSDWYSSHPEREDGGYLAALVAACQEELAGLPAIDTVRVSLQRAAKRCGEGQSHTHAEILGRVGNLEGWAKDRDVAPGYEWWEVAAGASSSVAIHTLIAAAADGRTSAEEARLIDAAYFPSIGALTVLLDDLVDRDQDLEAGEHNYLSYPSDANGAGNRIGLLAARARAALEPLRHAPRHRAILSGVAAFYLSSLAADSGYAEPIRERLLESLDPTVRLIMVALRMTRHG